MYSKKTANRRRRASPVDSIDVSALTADCDVPIENVFVNIVTVDVAEYAKTHFEKSVKKTLTIPEWLNKAALEQNINFRRPYRTP